VVDGRISILATDHAPHTWEEKQGTYFNAPSGLPLIQHTLLLMLEMCEQNCFTPELIVERACHAPARLFQVEGRGYLREGYWADLVVVDPEGKTPVKNTELFSKCNWSPFPHLTFTNSITTTIVSGKVAYDHGKIQMDCRGQRAEFAKDRR
jgi:dihydroorotase